MTKPKSTLKSTRKTESPGSAADRRDEESPLGGTWIDQRLKALYEPVLSEPLPEDLLRLLEPRKH